MVTADSDCATETGENMSKGEQASNSKDKNADADIKSPGKVERFFRKGMKIFCFLGIIWTCLHPVVSVLTGEDKCRGWYLDEHSVDIKFTDGATGGVVPGHLRALPPRKPFGSSSICEYFRSSEDSITSNMHCHVHGTSFEMVSIVPLSNAVDPLEEALVFVVPPAPNGDWTASHFHFSLTRSIKHLLDPVVTPWLAKTVILVSPISSQAEPVDSILEDTVTTFLDSYLGSRGKSLTSATPPLPPSMSNGILRTLIVLDINDESTTQARPTKDQVGHTEFAILPQGRRGVLPNLDLVFLVGKLFSKAMFVSPRKHPKSTILTHPYTQISKDAKSILADEEAGLNVLIQRWGEDFTDMLLFAYTMALGPYPPHAAALDRGIDAVTIRANFLGDFYRDPSIEMVQFFEFMVRALSNIHERLHHSHTLYLLASPSMFVSHMEYFLPNVLVLLPLAIRGFGLVLFHDAKPLSLKSIGMAILLTLSTMAVSACFLTAETEVSVINSILLGWYTLLLLVWKFTVLVERRQGDVISSLQSVACVLAAYFLAPIAFAHTSLSYVPSLIWTDLLAFPDYRQAKGSVVLKITLVLCFLVSAPPVLLAYVFSTVTPFVQFVYVPLHSLMWLLLVSIFLD